MKVLASGKHPFAFSDENLVPGKKWSGWVEVYQDLGLSVDGLSSELVRKLISLIERIAMGDADASVRRNKVKLLNHINMAFQVRMRVRCHAWPRTNASRTHACRRLSSSRTFTTRT